MPEDQTTAGPTVVTWLPLPKIAPLGINKALQAVETTQRKVPVHLRDSSYRGAARPGMGQLPYPTTTGQRGSRLPAPAVQGRRLPPCPAGWKSRSGRLERLRRPTGKPDHHECRYCSIRKRSGAAGDRGPALYQSASRSPANRKPGNISLQWQGFPAPPTPALPDWLG